MASVKSCQPSNLWTFNPVNPGHGRMVGGIALACPILLMKRQNVEKGKCQNIRRPTTRYGAQTLSPFLHFDVLTFRLFDVYQTLGEES